MQRFLYAAKAVLFLLAVWLLLSLLFWGIWAFIVMPMASNVS